MGNARDIIPLAMSYSVILIVIVASFALIYQNRAGDGHEAWLAIGTALGYAARDAGGAAGVRNAERIAAATTTSSTP